MQNLPPELSAWTEASLKISSSTNNILNNIAQWEQYPQSRQSATYLRITMKDQLIDEQRNDRRKLLARVIRRCSMSVSQ
jgi:hypothetical protein